MKNGVPIPYKISNVTIKIPLDFYKELTKDIDVSKIVSDKILTLCERYKEILEISTYELNDKFTKDEFHCIYYSLQGLEIPEEIRFNPLQLALAFEQSDKAADFCKARSITVDSVCDKLRKLTAAQVDALYTWIKENK